MNRLSVRENVFDVPRVESVVTVSGVAPAIVVSVQVRRELVGTVSTDLGNHDGDFLRCHADHLLSTAGAVLLLSCQLRELNPYALMMGMLRLSIAGLLGLRSVSGLPLSGLATGCLSKVRTGGGGCVSVSQDALVFRAMSTSVLRVTLAVKPLWPQVSRFFAAGAYLPLTCGYTCKEAKIARQDS